MQKKQKTVHYYWGKKAFIYILLMMSTFQIQASQTTDFQSWWNLTATGPFHKGNKATGFQYWLEGQERVGEDSTRFSQTLLRSGVGYLINDHTSIWLGYAWVDTGRPITNVSFQEDRLWQQLLWVKKYPQITLTSRSRLEERFFENAPRTAWRIREMLKIVSPLVSKPKFSIVGSNELFVRMSNSVGPHAQVFDQNRFFIGVGYKLNTLVTTEIGYLNQFVFRPNTPNFWTNDISTSIFLNFS